MKNSKAVYRPVPGGTRDFLLFENIKGMCKPLKKMLNIREIKLEDLKVKHFFPYIHIASGKQGYFFKQKDGSFKTLTQQQWRSILRGKANNLRPKDGIPTNNRMKAFNLDTNEEIDICYWPDVQYEYYLKMMHKKKPSSSNANTEPGGVKKKSKGRPKNKIPKSTSTTTNEDQEQQQHEEPPHELDSTLSYETNCKILQSIPLAIQNTSFDFLINVSG